MCRVLACTCANDGDSMRQQIEAGVAKPFDSLLRTSSVLPLDERDLCWDLACSGQCSNFPSTSNLTGRTLASSLQCAMLPHAGGERPHCGQESTDRSTASSGLARWDQFEPFLSDKLIYE